MKMLTEEETWDKKKLTIGILAILFLALFIYFGILNSSKVSNDSVRGESTVLKSTNPKIDLKKDLDTKIKEIKQNADDINVVEIASSSPQIQKVINDIKNLQNLPSNQAKDACLKICNGL